MRTTAESNAIGTGLRTTPLASFHQPPSWRDLADRAARRLKPRGGESVDAMAKQYEQSGQHEQSNGSCAERDERATDSHRVEDPQGEGEQAEHRRGDCDAAEEHRPASRLKGALDRCCWSCSARELLPVAVEHEQAVVDSKAKAHAADEVEREDR